MRDLIRRWLGDRPVPWERSSPAGLSQAVAVPEDTPAGYVCLRDAGTGGYVVVTPGTRACDALRAQRLPDGRPRYEQVHLPTRRTSGA